MKLQALFKADIELAPAQELGAGPLGRRRIIAITGGRFFGERLSGRVLPGGADWQVIRADGVADLDARYALETDDGALIYVTDYMHRHGPEAVLERLAAGGNCGSGAILHAHRAAFRNRRPALRLAEPHRVRRDGTRRPTAVELEVFEVL